MFPIKDENPTLSRPYVTILLIAINVVVFLTEPVFATGRQGAVDQITYFACRAAIPFEVTHGTRVADELRGREFPPDPEASVYAIAERLECPRKNVWLSILSSMFLHGSLLHIAGNMLFLWVFGNNVEDRLGKLKYILFYLLAGVAATYAQSYVFPSSATPLIGASGAIAGILGAYLLMFPRARIRHFALILFIPIFFDLSAAWSIGLWFLLQLLQGVGSVASETGVAYMAHVGGFLAGMLLLLPFRPKPAPARSTPY
ncbi:MAG: rhomboid family intramembrane serine protease [Actinomycetota bacterium]